MGAAVQPFHRNRFIAKYTRTLGLHIRDRQLYACMSRTINRRPNQLGLGWSKDEHDAIGADAKHRGSSLVSRSIG